MIGLTWFVMTLPFRLVFGVIGAVGRMIGIALGMLILATGGATVVDALLALHVSEQQCADAHERIGSGAGGHARWCAGCEAAWAGAPVWLAGFHAHRAGRGRIL